jgi:hypothetical protein
MVAMISCSGKAGCLRLSICNLDSFHWAPHYAMSDAQPSSVLSPVGHFCYDNPSVVLSSPFSMPNGSYACEDNQQRFKNKQ